MNEKNETKPSGSVDIEAELTATKKMAKLLEDLDDRARARALAYTVERFFGTDEAAALWRRAAPSSG